MNNKKINAQKGADIKMREKNHKKIFRCLGVSNHVAVKKWQRE